MTKGTPRPTSIYRLQIDRLPPGHNIRLGIRTSLQPWKDRDFSFDTPLWRGLNEPPSVAFYFDGNYQFEYQGIRIPRQFFAPIGYDKDSREMRLIEVLDNYGTWKRVEHVAFC